MTAVVALAFVAGAAMALAVLELARGVPRILRAHAPVIVGEVTKAVETAVRIGRDGRDPDALERRRTLAVGASAALCVGSLLAGPLAGIAGATVGPWAVSRGLAARRDHYRRAVDSGAADAALAIADALAAGHSLRAAIAEAARGTGGQIGHELRRTAAELAAGSETASALDALRRRVRSRRLDTLVTACLVQRSAGGDLARLLRECVGTFSEQARLEGEARAATAQARFTGLLVALLPLGGAGLAELASPGFAAALLASWMTAWLVGLAMALQVAAAVAIRRLGRVSV